MRIFFASCISQRLIFTQVQDLQTKFLDYLRFEKRYSPHTLTAYTKDLSQFRDYMFAEYDALDIHKIKRIHIRSWMASLREQDVTPQSIQRKMSTLSSFFRYMRKLGLLESSPMLNIIKPKAEKRLATFIREDKIKQVLQAAQSPAEDQRLAVLNPQIIIEILYQTGMRRSELLNLTLNRTDIPGRELRVIGKGNKERIIPINAALADLIAAYILERQPIAAPENKHLLVLPNGKPLYPKYIYNCVKKVLQSSSTLNKNSPHVLRHTFATHLLNEGADINAIKELLGHASLAATQIYTHNGIEKLKNVHKKAHPKS